MTNFEAARTLGWTRKLRWMRWPSSESIQDWHLNVWKISRRLFN